MSKQQDVPTVLVFAGTDPTGGAGIQAAIEALASHGCHAAPVVTTLTVQDTTDVHGFAPLDAEIIIEQARAILEDMPVAAVLVSLLASSESVEAVHSVLVDYPEPPLILDPVLGSGGGTPLADEDVMDAIISLLLPFTNVLTPNTFEARALAPGADTLDACAMSIMENETEHVLITGTHDSAPDVVNSLYTDGRLLKRYTWERLPHSYHGSGCTLSASIAGLMAQGMSPVAAIETAQQYTWDSLKYGYRLGMGQHIPNRFFWTQDHKKKTKAKTKK